MVRRRDRYRKDVLVHAYERCEANGGAAGVDEQTFEDIERYGMERWLDELTQELKSRTYQPQPVRRVYIPKPDGKHALLRIFPFPGDHAPQVRKKFFYHAESHVARHADAETDGSISGRVLTGRLPRPG
jgi:hypothetical protein